METKDIVGSKNWQRLMGQKIHGPLRNAVRDEILIQHEQGHRLKLCIGTDSQVKTNPNRVEFVTALVFRKEGKGAFVWKHRMIHHCDMTIRERMINEAAYSIQVGMCLNGLLEELNVAMEIHADINTDPQFKSNIAFKEVMGYVLGVGFEFVAKPDAFASSNIADRIVTGGKYKEKVA